MPTPHLSRENRVEAVIRSACHRRLLVLVLEQLALTLALIFGGGILLLLLGTQILDWYWLALLAAIGLVVGGTRLKRQLLPPYAVAQTLDHRLHLSDSLSTAHFLLSQPERPPSALDRLQLEYAENIASTIEPRTAFPFKGHRTWTLAAALAAVVFGLFAVRYLVRSSLDLQQSLVPIHLGPVLERLENALSAANRQPKERSLDARNQPDDLKKARPQNYGEQQKQDVIGFQDQNSSRTPDPSASTPPATQKVGAEQQGKTQDGKPSDKSAGPQGTQQNSTDNAMAPGDQKNQPAPNTKEQAANSQQSSPGLLDKMKDAVSSMMAKMRPSEASQKGMQNNEKSPADNKPGQTSPSNKDQQNQSQNSKDQQSSEDPNSQGNEQGQTTEKAQASQGRNSDKANDKQGSDAHSGVGRQDGAKDIKEAEQQQAMGKLAEIIGKRSASLTGEVMIETPSGKQQLKTQYSQKTAHHTDLGGEINRDQVPLMYQQYVKEYMEQVRKQAKSEEAVK